MRQVGALQTGPLPGRLVGRQEADPILEPRELHRGPGLEQAGRDLQVVEVPEPVIIIESLAEELAQDLEGKEVPHLGIGRDIPRDQVVQGLPERGLSGMIGRDDLIALSEIVREAVFDRARSAGSFEPTAERSLSRSMR